MTRSVRRVVLSVLVAAMCAAGTVTAGAGSAPSRAGADVTTYQVTLVDPSRPTDATSVLPASDERTLETTIAFPTDAKKRLPLIVLAHGLDGNPGKFKILMSAWAAAGYVVAAPQFPLTNDLKEGESLVPDYENQPADVSFTIDEVLKMGKKSSDEKIAGLVDKRHIGVAGLSLGGGTVYGLVFNTCCIDERVDAAVVMSGIRLDFDEGEFDFRDLPTLLVHGDADGIYNISVETYPQLGTPKWFVTLHESTHAAPFEDSVDPADDAVPVITTAFFDRYLKGEKAAAKRLVKAVDDYDQAELQRAL